MKSIRILLLFLAILSAMRSSQAAENRYDVFGKTLAPLAAIFSAQPEGVTRAVSADVTLVEMTGLPPDFAATTVSLAIQSPDKVRLSGAVLGEEVTLCRNGQELWAQPGARLEELLARVEDMPPPREGGRIGDFHLPIPEKQLAFLPVLFEIADAGEENIRGEICRVLELRLIADVIRGKKNPLEIRLWVAPGYKPARLRFARKKWRLLLDFPRVEYADSLPAGTWQPAEDADVLKLGPARFRQLLDLALDQIK